MECKTKREWEILRRESQVSADGYSRTHSISISGQFPSRWLMDNHHLSGYVIALSVIWDLSMQKTNASNDSHLSMK
jgi:hypothetical protein